MTYKSIETSSKWTIYEHVFNLHIPFSSYWKKTFG